MIRVQAEPFQPDAELADLLARAPGAGAAVFFVGQVRGEAGAVSTLTLDHYPAFTERGISTIVAAGEERFGWSAVSVIHRHGRLEAGEAIVFVGVAASHRRAAFEAADYLMDRLKTEAPFWKREDGPAGNRWIEPSEADRADRARWGDGI
uniref:molybdenum cofactor biosynthesis protein MoaE n=1 Tax=uncultured Sphingomonas sp. TaxID=158754 RepID=UPI0025F73D01|nr:molybdenum cofactor biosynthesis protein MoaE [uncultured Sphingomonas sp.]